MMKRRAREASLHEGGGAQLGRPPAHLSRAEIEAWRDIVAVCPPGVLRANDAFFLEHVAEQLALWRAGRAYLPVREFYRSLGEFLIELPGRRRLLFPDRPKRSELN